MNDKNIRLVVESEDVDFSTRPAITIIDINPLISDGQGSYTYPFSLPLNPHNIRPVLPARPRCPMKRTASYGWEPGCMP